MFWTDRHYREEGDEDAGDLSKQLEILHETTAATDIPNVSVAVSRLNIDGMSDVLYMCQKNLWEEAKNPSGRVSHPHSYMMADSSMQLESQKDSLKLQIVFC